MADDQGGGTPVLEAPLVLEYPFNRTTGPVIGAFLTGLRDQRVLGIRGVDGRVVCPPVEYDPQTGEPLTELVAVGAEGTVTSWSWVTTIREGQTLDHPHALALIRLDGADTAMLHVVDGPVATGDRVRIRWADEREGLITDIVAFERIA
jgi:hypothetical protein